MAQDARRLVARLAVAVMAADRRITPGELAALEGLAEHELPALARLDRLGLGSLSEIVYEEARRAETEPVDVPAVCAALAAAAPRAAPVILSALTEIAASDGVLVPRETEMLDLVAQELGLAPSEARGILASVLAGQAPAGPPAAPVAAGAAEVEHAHRVLGVEVGVGPQQIEAAYRRLVERYNPAKVVDLGCDFAALAVRTLSDITDAYATAIGALDTRH
jgi:DnaJ-domain-containing protein 1